ncbi:TniQ family protein [Pseudomonas mosselii]|nr:TniQ family protein [Pseudomonas mosselii]
MFGLLINPRPHHDESLSGYLQRLALANGLTSNDALRAFKQADDCDVKEWIRHCGTPRSWHEAAVELRSPITRPFKIWSVRSVRFCAQCLAEGGYWKETWEITLVTSCTSHRTELLNCCPHCSLKTCHNSMLDNRCKACGFSLASPGAEEYTRLASEPCQWLSSALENAFYSPPLPNAGGLSGLPFNDLHELAARLAVRRTRAQTLMQLKVPEISSVGVSRTLADAAARILMDWPSAFRQLLGDLKHAHSSSGEWKVTSAFGPIYRDIHHSLSSPCFSFVRDEFESYLLEEWAAPLSNRNRYLSHQTVENHLWVPLQTGAKAMGLSRAALVTLCQRGLVDHREENRGSRLLRVVHLGQLQEVSYHRHAAVTLSGASKILGLSMTRVRQLLSGGLLEFFGEHQVGRSPWLVSRDSLDELMPGDVDLVTESGLLTINFTAKHYLPAGGGLVELLQAIKSGALQAYRSNKDESAALGQLLVRSTDLALWMQERFRESDFEFSGLSVSQAAAILGVKEEVAYACVRLGLLKSNPAKIGRCTQHRVTPKAIETFRQRYILGPEIAAYLGMSPRDSLRHLWDIRFRPVAGPTMVNASCRQYVWSRSKKLADYLVWRTAHGSDADATQASVQA